MKGWFMKKSILACCLIAWGSTKAIADQFYSQDFVNELREIGREQEAFYYALSWAGSGHPQAELEVIYTLLEGKGINADPMAAILFACGPRHLDEFSITKVLIQANLRLAGVAKDVIRCETLVKE